MRCYSCANDATHECRRCGRLYCDEHGDELCAECLKPAGALPSFLLYRGSLLALLLGTVVALWLLLKPPEEASKSTFNIVQPTATPTVLRTPTTEAAVTPAIVTTATPTAASVDYTVQDGDSLFDIASRYQPPGVELTDFAARIATANGLDPANPLLSVGQVLHIPQ
jgi:Tfp pilus assembly protein FimV